MDLREGEGGKAVEKTGSRSWKKRLGWLDDRMEIYQFTQ